MTWLRSLIIAVALLLPGVAAAVSPDEMLADPVLEQRARDISAELRCLVCQNQSIDDSDADLARDLRLLVRERLVAGDSDEDVRQYVVDRYGEYVLLNPRVSTQTLLLWGAAPALLVVGLVALWLAGRRRSAAEVGSDGLTAEERAALDELKNPSP
jgi:cytochrome c-type biogenesis protein CcmH